MSQGYGGFYTRQEAEDAKAARLEPNPNRVGSGFINFGAMERSQQPAANWQTGGLVGGAPTPSQVSDIWGSSTPGAPSAGAPGLGAQSYGAPAPPPNSVPQVDNLFQNMGIDGARGGPAAPPPQSYSGGINSYDVNAMSSAAVQQPFAQQQPQTTQALMSLLQPGANSATGSAAAPALGAYGACNGGGMAQGSCGASLAQAAFTSIPSPQCQLPHNGGAFAPNAFPGATQPHSKPTAGRAGQPPRELQSAADYAAAAVNYRPPAPPRAPAPGSATNSVSRKPEATRAPPAAASAATANNGWDCPRCTFLNNGALRECEMCGFERVGANQGSAEPPAAATPVADDGWRTASASMRKSAPLPNGSAAANTKSKAQAKNEKRRAKKRGE